MFTFTNRLTAAFKELPDSKQNKNQLARFCGAGPSSVTDWFSGKTKNPSAKAVPRLAEYLDVSERWLLEGKGTKQRGIENLISLGNQNEISEELGTWVKSARSHAGLSLEALGEAIGRTKQTVWSIEKGKIEPSYRQLIKISECTKYTEPLPGMEEKHPDWTLQNEISGGLVEKGYLRLDYLDIESSAGDGAVVEYQPQIKQLLVLEDWAKKYLKTSNTDNIKIINNRGVSMHPTIKDGDVLFVDVSQTSFDSDGIYIIAVNGELRTKRLIQLIDGRLEIVSDNPAPGYKPEHIDKKNYDSLIICGKVRYYFSLMQAV